jgi:hypothetical protein
VRLHQRFDSLAQGGIARAGLIKEAWPFPGGKGQRLGENPFFAFA